MPRQGANGPRQDVAFAVLHETMVPFRIGHAPRWLTMPGWPGLSGPSSLPNWLALRQREVDRCGECA